MVAKARKSKRIKPRFYIVLVGFLAVVGVGVFLLMGGGRDDDLTMSAVRLEYGAKAVLLRDESVATAERYDKILFDVAEGAYVGENEQIAQVFKWGYQEDTMQTLFAVQRQIYEYQLQMVEDILKPELEALQLQIQQKLAEIRATVGGDAKRDVLALEKELKELLEQRAQMLREIVQPDETLTVLYEQEDVQLNNLATWKSDRANVLGSGVVSFYFDGYEQALNTEKLDVINADLISDVLKGGGTVTTIDTTVENPLYRLINPNHFYIAFLTDTISPFRLAKGESYTVVFNGYANTPFTGTALQPVVADKQVVNMLEFHQNLDDLMGVRVVEATIMKDVTGLRVPISAIDMQNNLPGILRVSGDDIQWVQVEVLATDGTDAIIRSAGQAQPLTEGTRYRKPRRKSAKG